MYRQPKGRREVSGVSPHIDQARMAIRENAYDLDGKNAPTAVIAAVAKLTILRRRKSQQNKCRFIGSFATVTLLIGGIDEKCYGH